MYGSWFFVGILYVFVFYIFLYAPSERKYDKMLQKLRRKNIERMEKRKKKQKTIKKKRKRVRKRFW